MTINIKGPWQFQDKFQTSMELPSIPDIVAEHNRIQPGWVSGDVTIDGNEYLTN
jgi:hypothetical protein